MHLKRDHKVHNETQRSKHSIVFFVFVVVLRVLSGLPAKYGNIML
jgi:hypothetical protein